MNNPQALNLTYNQIYFIAQKIAKDLGYNAKLNFKNLLQDKLKWHIVKDYYIYSASKNELVVENEKCSYYPQICVGPLRERFNLAHALGHYILHYLYPKRHSKNHIDLEAPSFGSTQADKEANLFAYAFLMPSELYEKVYRQYQGNHFLISQELQVTRFHSHIKAKSLGLEK